MNTTAPMPAAASQNGSSAGSPSSRPAGYVETCTPRSPSWPVRYSSSFAAAAGSCSGTDPSPANRSGRSATRPATCSFCSRDSLAPKLRLRPVELLRRRRDRLHLHPHPVHPRQPLIGRGQRQRVLLPPQHPVVRRRLLAHEEARRVELRPEYILDERRNGRGNGGVAMDVDGGHGRQYRRGAGLGCGVGVWGSVGPGLPLYCPRWIRRHLRRSGLRRNATNGPPLRNTSSIFAVCWAKRRPIPILTATTTRSKRAQRRPRVMMDSPMSGSRIGSAGNTKGSTKTSARPTSSSCATTSPFSSPPSSSSPILNVSKSHEVHQHRIVDLPIYPARSPHGHARPIPLAAPQWQDSPAAPHFRRYAFSSALFEDRDRLKPNRTTDAITRDAAQVFFDIAETLRKWGIDHMEIARFVSRIVVLHVRVRRWPPAAGHLLGCSPTAHQDNPKAFQEALSKLFETMQTGGRYGAYAILHFNGDLFTDAECPRQPHLRRTTRTGEARQPQLGRCRASHLRHALRASPRREDPGKARSALHHPETTSSFLSSPF